MPRTPISLACGVLFGPVAGSLLALAVALTAAALTFFAGRLLGRDFVARYAGRRLTDVQGWLRDEGCWRWPRCGRSRSRYGLLGYVYGASTVRARDYFLGTLVAATPSAISYAILGALSRSRDAAAGVLPLAMGLAFSVIVLLRTRRRVRRT